MPWVVSDLSGFARPSGGEARRSFLAPPFLLSPHRRGRLACARQHLPPTPRPTHRPRRHEQYFDIARQTTSLSWKSTAVNYLAVI